MNTATQKRIKELDKEITSTEKKLRNLMQEDRTSYAQGIIDKMFAEFKKGAAWTRRMKKYAEEEFYVYSPIWRKRNLPAALTGDKAIIAKQVRRGSNAPIQGFASEIGVKAGRVIMETYFEHLPELCKLLGIKYSAWRLRVPYNRAVHDANYYSVPFAMVIPFIHIVQYCATYGITKRYKDEFGIEFTVEPEIELEVGARDDNTAKWDWSIPSLVKGVVESLDDMEEMKLLDEPKDKILKEIFKPWAKKDTRHYLQKKWPLLNVTDLDTQITDAIRFIYKDKKA